MPEVHKTLPGVAERKGIEHKSPTEISNWLLRYSAESTVLICAYKFEDFYNKKHINPESQLLE